MTVSTLKKITTLSLVLLSLLFVTSCDKKDEGAKSDKKVEKLSPEAEIKKSVNGLFNAMKEGDLDKMTSFMTKESNADFNKMFGEVSPEELKLAKAEAVKMLKEMMKDATIKIDKVTITGDKAVVENTAVVDGKEDKEPVELVREDGAWKVIFEM